MTFKCQKKLLQHGVSSFLAVLIFSGGAKAQEAAPAQQVQPTLADRKKIESIVFLNETGIISVNYDEPWWFEIPEYAASLGSVLNYQIVAAKEECTALLEAMSDSQSARLGPQTKDILGSLVKDGEVPYSQFVSSLLRNYTHPKRIDREAPDDRGSFKALRDRACTSPNPGPSTLISQMFPVPFEPGFAGGKEWSVGFCEQVDVVRSCLATLQHLEDERSNQYAMDGPPIELNVSTVFTKVETVSRPE